ncbi:fibronectin type III domain-containing protein, partial [Fulvivirga sp. 29W222]
MNHNLTIGLALLQGSRQTINILFLGRSLIGFVLMLALSSNLASQSIPTTPILSISNTTETQITVTWTASTADAGIKYYHMEVADPVSGTTLITQNNLAPNSNSFTLNGQTNATYRFKLRAEDNNGNFSNEATIDATQSAQVTSPTDPVLSISNITETDITIGWTASTAGAGIKNYQLTVTESGTATVITNESNLTSGTLSYALTGLTPNTTYDITLRAVDNNDNFSNDVTISATTLQAGSGSGSGEVCWSAEEKALYLAINDYRATNGLPPVPLSPKLSQVAQLHAQDAEDYPPTSSECNAHSWSSNGSWTACCYTNDHSNANCMWDKPAEITGYQSPGYENYAWTSATMTATEALQQWQNSPSHNDLILNIGSYWENQTWNAMGIGIRGGTAFLWFGELVDGEVHTSAETITDCSGGFVGSDPPQNPDCMDMICDHIFIDNTGNVGIGNPNPQASLHVKGQTITDSLSVYTLDLNNGYIDNVHMLSGSVTGALFLSSSTDAMHTMEIYEDSVMTYADLHVKGKTITDTLSAQIIDVKNGY